MGAFLSFFQFVAGAAYYDFVTVLYEIAYEFSQIESAGATVDESHIIDAERRLQLSHLIELVEYHVRIGVALDIDCDVHLSACGGVGDVGDTVDFLFLHEVGDAFYEFVFDYAVWDFGDYDYVMVAVGLDFAFCPDYDTSASGLVGVAHTLHSEDFASCREIRGYDVLH